VAIVMLVTAGCGTVGVTDSGSTPTHQTAISAPATQAAQGPVQATVTIGPRAPTRAVPPSYFGVSTEYWAIPLFERSFGQFVRILQLLHAPGTGPFVLRVGGDSTDHAVFDVDLGRRPGGIFELDGDWFAHMSALVRDVSARLILDLNLVTDLPRMAGLWADAAIDELPRGTVAGFEIGNEPDLYRHSYWMAVFSRARPLARDLPPQLTPARYVDLFQSYGRSLSALAPHVPLFGPVVAYPIAHHRWITALLEGRHPGLRMVTAHTYPYSACASPLSRSYPTVARLLTEQATAGVVARLRRSIDLAHAEGLPFRLTELNSVTCGGAPGVSDTFATALWAPDMLFELLRAGVDGVNIHVRAYAVNAAFALARHGVVARPLLYGLILFTRMLGPDARFVAVHLRTDGHLKAWAVQVAGRTLHVLLINKGARQATVRLRVPATGSAAVQRLLAPAATARSGVTLDGQHLDPNDQWRGRPSGETIARLGGAYRLALPPISAALATVQLARGAPSSRAA
jgi:hypothetical protein